MSSERPRAPRLTRADLGAGLDLLILVSLFFLPAATMQGVAFYGNAANYFPRLVYNTRSLLDGRLPEWNADLSGGYPHLADPGAMAFYPVQYPFFVLLPFFAAFNYYILWHYVLAGAGMYALVRALGRSRLAALLSGVVFMLNGFMVAHFQHVNIIIAASYLPWLLLCVEWVWQRRTLLPALGGAFILGLQLLGGHVQIVVYGLMMAAAYTLFRMIVPVQDYSGVQAPAGNSRMSAEPAQTSSPASRPRLRSWLASVWLPVALVAAMVIVGMLLASAQIVPEFELVSFTQRGGRLNYEFATSFSLPPERLLTYFVPYLFGGPKWGQVWGRGSFLELTGYVGITGLTLAAIGAIAFRRERRTWFFVGLAVASLLLALGGFTPLYRLVFLVPFLNTMRAPARFMILADLALAVLASYGLDALRFDWTRLRARRTVLAVGALIALAFAAVVGAYLVLSRIPNPSSGVAGALSALRVRSPVLFIPFGSALLTLGWLAGRAKPWIFSRARQNSNALSSTLPDKPLFALLGVVLVSAELFVLGSRLYYNEVARPEAYDLLPVYARYFGEPTDAFRVYHPLKGETNLYDLLDVPDYRTYETIFAERFDGGEGLLLQVPSLTGYGVESQRFLDLETWIDQAIGTDRSRQAARGLGLMSAKYLATRRDAGAGFRLRVDGDHADLYENRAVLPRAFLARRVRVIRDPSKILPALLEGDLDLAQEAVVEQPIALEPNDGGDPGAVSFQELTPEHIQIEVNASYPALLVLNDNYYPGWNAYLDGTPTPIYRTNYLVRGVLVPAGSHRVEFRYEPTSVRLGLALSGLAVLALGGGLAWELARRVGIRSCILHWTPS